MPAILDAPVKFSIPFYKWRNYKRLKKTPTEKCFTDKAVKL